MALKGWNEQWQKLQNDTKKLVHSLYLDHLKEVSGAEENHNCKA